MWKRKRHKHKEKNFKTSSTLEVENIKTNIAEKERHEGQA